jgi:hypothetical protein
MKFKISAIFLALIFISTAYRCVADEDKYFLLPEGSKYGSADHTIAVENIQRLPEQSFPDEELPLSPRQAALIALEGFKDCFDGDATVKQIDLCRFPAKYGINRFYYYVLLRAPSDRMKMMGRDLVDTTTVSYIVPVVKDPSSFFSRAYRVIPKEAEQAGTGQPATRSQSKSEGGEKPQHEAEGRSR